VKVLTAGSLSGEQDALAEKGQAGAAEHLALDHLDVVDPAFDGAGTPGHGQAVGDGVQVLLQPLGERRDAGQPGVAGIGDPMGQAWPVSSVSMPANARTWSDAVCSSGQRSRMAVSRGFSSPVRESGRRVSQFVTSRTVGGACGSGVLAGRIWSR